jgi:hypothetical protein
MTNLLRHAKNQTQPDLGRCYNNLEIEACGGGGRGGDGSSIARRATAESSTVNVSDGAGASAVAAAQEWVVQAAWVPEVQPIRRVGQAATIRSALLLALQEMVRREALAAAAVQASWPIAAAMLARRSAAADRVARTEPTPAATRPSHTRPVTSPLGARYPGLSAAAVGVARTGACRGRGRKRRYQIRVKPSRMHEQQFILCGGRMNKRSLSYSGVAMRLVSLTLALVALATASATAFAALLTTQVTSPLIAPSQAFIGTPTAPTQGATDNSTKLATAASIVNAQACQTAATVGFVAGGSPSVNLAAWNAWVTSIGSNSACLIFGGGFFESSSPWTATLSAGQTITIEGAGKDATELWWSTGNGISVTGAAGSFPGYLNSSSVTLANLSVTTSGAGVGNGISIDDNTTIGNGARATMISNVAFRGHAGTSGYWTNEISLTDLTAAFVNNVDIYGEVNTNTNGIGVSYVGSAAGTTPTVLQINNLQALFKGTAVSATGYFQGVNVAQSNLTDVGVGVSCNASSLETYCNVTNSQIDAVLHDVVLDNIQQAQIASNLLIMGRTGLVNLNGMVQMISSPSNGVTNNIFSASTVGGATPVCVDLSSASQNYQSIAGNTFLNCAADVAFGSTAPIDSVLGPNATNTTLTSGATTGLTQFGIVQAATDFFFSNTGPPTVATGGGTGPSIGIGSTSEYGSFVTGTGTVTSITLTFATAFPHGSFCLVQQATGTLVSVKPSSNATQLAVAFGASTPSTQWTWSCRGY